MERAPARGASLHIGIADVGRTSILPHAIAGLRLKCAAPRYPTMAFLNPPPPQAQPPPTLLEQPTIEGASLVVPLNYTFPAVCLATGATEDLVPMRRSVTWHPSVVYLTILVNIIVYIVAALVTRRVSYHQIYLTRSEKQRRTRLLVANWVIFASTFIFLSAAIALETGTWAYAAVGTLVLSLVLYFTKVRLVYAERITPSSVRLRGIPLPVMQKIAAMSPR